MNFETMQVFADLLRAVAHPTRLMILDELAKGVKCVTDIRELLNVRQANVSQHLTILRHQGLVDFYRDGGSRRYYLRVPMLVEALFDFLQGDYPPVRLTGENARR